MKTQYVAALQDQQLLDYVKSQRSVAKRTLGSACAQQLTNRLMREIYLYRQYARSKKYAHYLNQSFKIWREMLEKNPIEFGCELLDLFTQINLACQRHNLKPIFG